MKKLISIIGVLALVLIGTMSVQATETSKELANNIKRQVKIPVYTNERAKTMCSEWPGCEKWAVSRYKKNNSFRVRDVEVEYYFTDYTGDTKNRKGGWKRNFYVEVTEDAKPQAYVFERSTQVNCRNPYPDTPKKIKTFPGHPLTYSLSKHALNSKGQPTLAEIKQKWAPKLQLVGIMDLWSHVDVFAEEQRVVWDKTTGKPLWRMALHVRFIFRGGRSPKRYYVSIEAKQKQYAGPYTLEKGNRLEGDDIYWIHDIW